SGASLADIATAHGKSVKGLQRAITDETQRRLAAVANLSDVERQQLLNHVIGQLDDMVQRDGRPAGWSGRGGPWRRVRSSPGCPPRRDRSLTPARPGRSCSA